MRAPQIISVVCGALLLAGAAAADPVTPPTSVVTVFSAVSAASGSSDVYSVWRAKTLNIQVCGATFSGTVTIKQGSTSTSLVASKTLTLSGHNDCSEYYALDPSSYVQIDYTRTAGTLTVYLEWYP